MSEGATKQARVLVLSEGPQSDGSYVTPNALAKTAEAINQGRYHVKSRHIVPGSVVVEDGKLTLAVYLTDKEAADLGLANPGEKLAAGVIDLTGAGFNLQG